MCLLVSFKESCEFFCLLLSRNFNLLLLINSFSFLFVSFNNKLGFLFVLVCFFVELFLLSAVCCLLFVVCCLLVAVCCVLCAVCCL